MTYTFKHKVHWNVSEELRTRRSRESGRRNKIKDQEDDMLRYAVQSFDDRKDTWYLRIRT